MCFSVFLDEYGFCLESVEKVSIFPPKKLIADLVYFLPFSSFRLGVGGGGLAHLITATKLKGVNLFL